MSGETQTVPPPVKTPEQLRTEQNDRFFDLLGGRSGQGLTRTQTEKVQGKLKEQETSAKKQQKLDLSGTKWKVLYEDSRQRADIMLGELRRLAPPADGLIKTFEEAIKSADKTIDESQKLGRTDYKTAAAPLDKALTGDPVGKAQKLWSEARDKARKQAPESYKLIEPLQDDLLSGKMSLMADVTRKYQAELVEIARVLLSGSVTSVEDRSTSEKVMKLSLAVRAAEGDANVAKRRVQGLRDRLGEMGALQDKAKLGELPTLDTAVFAKLERLRNTAETAFQLNDFATAEQMLTDLLAEVKLWDDRLGQARDGSAEAWSKAAGTLGDLMDRAGKIASSKETPKPLTEQAEAVGGRLAEIAEKEPGKGIGYAECLARVQKARSDLDVLERRALEATTFANVRDAAHIRVTVLSQETEVLLNTLDQRLAGLVKQDGGVDPDHIAGLIQPMQQRLAAARQGWAGKMKAAFDPTSLDEPATILALTTLKGEIQAASTEQGFQGTSDTLAVQTARGEYELVRDEARRAAEMVLSVDVETGSSYLEGIDELEGAIGSSTDVALFKSVTGQLQDALREIQGTTERNTKMLEQSRAALEKQLQPVDGQLKQMLEALGKFSDSGKRAPYEALHATLRTQYDSLRAMQGAQQINLLQQALTEAMLLARDATEALAAAQGKPLDDSMTPQNAAKLLEKYKQDLAAEVIQSFASMTAFAIGEKIEALAASLGAQGMASLGEKLQAIETAITNVKKQATDAQTKFKDIEKEVATVKEKLKAPAFKDNAPSFVEAKKGELDGLAANGRFEGGFDEAMAAVRKVGTDLDRMALGPKNLLGVPSEIANGETESVEKKRAAEIDEKKWTAEVAVLEKRLKAVADVDPSEIAGLLTTLAEAKKAADKSRDFSMGREQLQAIRGQLSLLEANPYGLVISARNKLPETRKRWRSAVAAFNTGLNEVKSAVTKSDLLGPDKDVVTGQLTEVRGLFNPAAFDGVVKAMAEKGEDRAKRSAAREVGLREARRMMTYIASDYRVRELASTPFRPGMDSVISELNLSLLDIENNMLVSL